MAHTCEALHSVELDLFHQARRPRIVCPFEGRSPPMVLGRLRGAERGGLDQVQLGIESTREDRRIRGHVVSECDVECHLPICVALSMIHARGLSPVRTAIGLSVFRFFEARRDVARARLSSMKRGRGSGTPTSQWLVLLSLLLPVGLGALWMGCATRPARAPAVAPVSVASVVPAAAAGERQLLGAAAIERATALGSITSHAVSSRAQRCVHQRRLSSGCVESRAELGTNARRRSRPGALPEQGDREAGACQQARSPATNEAICAMGRKEAFIPLQVTIRRTDRRQGHRSRDTGWGNGRLAYQPIGQSIDPLEADWEVMGRPTSEADRSRTHGGHSARSR
jgi:hypothetical protein